MTRLKTGLTSVRITEEDDIGDFCENKPWDGCEEQQDRKTSHYRRSIGCPCAYLKVADGSLVGRPRGGTIPEKIRDNLGEAATRSHDHDVAADLPVTAS